jgi:hypothetical protein
VPRREAPPTVELEVARLLDLTPQLVVAVGVVPRGVVQPVAIVEVNFKPKCEMKLGARHHRPRKIHVKAVQSCGCSDGFVVAAQKVHRHCVRTAHTAVTKSTRTPITATTAIHPFETSDGMRSLRWPVA